MISTQSSYGVRTSRPSSRPIKVPFLRQHLEPAEILDELETRAGDRDRFGDLDDPLPGMRVEIRSAKRHRVFVGQSADSDQKAAA